MTTFYFNEVLPSRSETDVCTVFEDLVTKASSFLDKVKYSKPVITCTAVSDLYICGLTLADIIKNCSNRDIRTQALYLFTHNLIREHESTLSDSEADAILEAEYSFEKLNATNLAIAYKMEWPLLTLPLAEEWEKDFLRIVSEKAESIQLPNYFGQDDTSQIEKWIAEKVNAGLTGLEKLKTLFGNGHVLVSTDFRKRWNDTTQLHQGIVFAKFTQALEKNMIFPPRYDDSLIKKVFDKAGIIVYELRQKGQGTRVYYGFSADGTKIVLAGLHTKAESEGDEQDADIKRAAVQIRKTIALESAQEKVK